MALLALGVISETWGQPSVPPPAARDFVSLDFDNADIRVVIKHISELTGHNFLVDEKVRGRVTIITPTRIRLEDVYQVFISILHTYGFTAVPTGEVIRILPLAEASRAGVPTVRPPELGAFPPSDRVVTSIIQMDHADASVLAAILRPMVAREGNIVPYVPSNALVLTDTVANVRRLTSVIRTLDIPAEMAVVEVVRLRHALAKDLAATLEKLVEGVSEAPSAAERAQRAPRPLTPSPAGPQRKPTKAIPDERANSLILLAPLPEMIRLRGLVKKLDVPAPPERRRIHVYRLENAVAEELARVLTQQIDTMMETAPRPASERASMGRISPRAPAPPARTSAPAPSAGGLGGTPILTDVTITPDKATNSLIIRASPEDYETLTEIIRNLDVRRSQVLVEGLIAEMTLDKTRELGVEWRILNAPKGRDTHIIGGTNLPLPGANQGIINQFATGPFAGSSGLILGAAQGTITFGGQTFFDLRGLIRAFQTDSDINILSTPQILTTDNEEAEIIVGENRPFVTQAQTTAEGSTVQTFEFRDVGVKLRITPHISPNRFVRMKIFQEITNFIAEAQVGAVTTTKRQATTAVTIEDGQTVVIGGLIRDDTTGADTKVPLLGDIPILGGLFRSESKKKVKTNLLIFITPRIVVTPEEHRRLTEFKQEETGQLLRPGPSSIKDRM